MDGYYTGSTTDVYHNGVMTTGPDLPGDFDKPVGTIINSTHIWLAGNDPYDTNFLIDVDTWEITQMPDMMEQKIAFSSGMVENEVGFEASRDDETMETLFLTSFQGGERELLVAGGHHPDTTDIVEIFNFGSWSWREGPKLPLAFHYGEPIQLSKTFLILGGHDGGRYLDTIYEFDNVNYGWILRNETLETGREYFTAIPLLNDWDVC